MSEIDTLAKKVMDQYGGPKGKGFNFESLASSMARWTGFNYADSLAALQKLN